MYSMSKIYGMNEACISCTLPCANHVPQRLAPGTSHSLLLLYRMHKSRAVLSVCSLTPAGYPEQYLARCKLFKAILGSIIIQGVSKPPSALHQHASAQQLYITLYFIPEALHGDNALMKAVVARYFSRSWVLPWAPGHFADVSLHWQRYRAARNALSATLTPAMARQLAATHGATALPLQRRKTQNLQDNIAKVSCSTSHLLCVPSYKRFSLFSVPVVSTQNMYDLRFTKQGHMIVAHVTC